MKKKIINLNIRIEPHVKEKAQQLAREKGVTITDLIAGYIVSDYALRSLFSFSEKEGEENVESDNTIER